MNTKTIVTLALIAGMVAVGFGAMAAPAHATTASAGAGSTTIGGFATSGLLRAVHQAPEIAKWEAGTVNLCGSSASLFGGCSSTKITED